MEEPQTVTAAEGRVTLSAGPSLRVYVDDVGPPLVAGRARLTVLARFTVATNETGGTVRVVVDTVPRRRCTVVVVDDAGPAVLALDVDGLGTVELASGHVLVLVVVEHSPRLSTEVVLGALSWPSDVDRSAEPPDLQVEPTLAFPSAPPQVLPRGGRDVVAAAPRRELAQVGASMPPVVALDDRVDVVVVLGRGEVRVDAGRAHDEQVIVLDPERPLTVTVLRRGFELDRSGPVAETGSRELRLAEAGAPDTEVVFALVAARVGLGEVQVVVRQDRPRPLATLRLTSRVLPVQSDPAALAPEEIGRGEASVGVAPGVSPLLVPKSLVVDENLVGTTSTLSFVLDLPGIQESFEQVIDDKSQVLAQVFDELAQAWADHQGLPTHAQRSAAFNEDLRSIGSRLAAATMPAALLALLHAHLADLDELTVITSGETDIPWELVHVGGAGPDPGGLGFLGRAGLVRWIYNTRHPESLEIRPGRAFHLVPEYADRSLALREAVLERAALLPFGAQPLVPSDAAGVAELLRSGRVDLLHFAGHGRCDDTTEPPVREMVLADFVPPAGVVPPPGDRSRVAFTLDDLRHALPDHEPLALGVPGPIVVLNACRLGQATPSQRSEVGGFAETFLRGGAGALVGCLWSVGDAPARAFVTEFYAQLHAGATMSRATVSAREAARLGGDLSWLAYTVYAHPDARLSGRPTPPTSPHRDDHQRGTAMTTTTTRTAQLGRDDLVALHPHVIDIEDGQLSLGSSRPPTSVRDFHTTEADVDAIFDTHLPAFVAGRTTPVPLVIHAHGGLVGKAGGLGVAHRQVEWWKANGAFPVQFVWHTGLLESFWDALADASPFGARGRIEEWTDRRIEDLLRDVEGRDTWAAMKRTAELASGARGGARYFARRLAAYVKERPGEVSVHAVGHSAGSIFHSHLIPQMLSAGVPEIASLNLLAPAIRVDEFAQRLLRGPTLEHIKALSMFTMREEVERQDTCMKVYRKSLLYLIRAALEDEQGAEILGLQECILRSRQLSDLFVDGGAGGKAEVIWSRTVDGPRASSTSTSHGGFDDDPPTMESLARRILGRDDLVRPFPAQPRSPEPWDAAPAAAAGTKRALCIGIDAYPAGNALAGCVADARLWAGTFTAAGFEVDLLLDEEATRERMVERIGHLIDSSRAGDVLALQYSGHGTFVDDLDGDEREEDGELAMRDEALCPVDFAQGNLLLDDDLGMLWDRLPDGVGLTIFFDSCHSGGAQRGLTQVVPQRPGATARLVILSDETVAGFKLKRGTRSATRATGSGDHERGVFFGACLPTEVAWESGGQGDFTRLAVPLVASLVGSGTNQACFDAVLAAFGDDRRQTPVLRPDHLASRPLFGASPAGQRPVEIPEVTTVPGTTGHPTPRDAAIAAILRGMADLIES